MSERWLPVIGFEGLYEVSDLGRVRSLKRSGRILRPGVNSSGYMVAGLSKNGIRTSVYVHALVLDAFRGPRPCGHDSCHENNSRTDNRLDNLRWDTRRQNMLDKIKHGTHQTGSKSPRAILSIEQVAEIRACKWERGKGKFFANKFDVSESTISLVHLGKIWMQKIVGLAA